MQQINTIQFQVPMQVLLFEYLEYLLLEIIDAVSVLVSDEWDAYEMRVILFLLGFHYVYLYIGR